MFRDYWTQVEAAERSQTGEVQLTEHVQRQVARYLDDSRNYRRRNGAIDGRLWFRAFSEHGGGVPFFLDDIFDGDAQALRAATESGELTLLPTSRIDSAVSRLTGEPTPRRQRVSSPTLSPYVHQALRDAEGSIDLLADRDAPFEEVIAGLVDGDASGGQ